MFSPTEHDRERLEVLHEQLSELQNDCGCGVNEACDKCGGEGISDSCYVCHHDKNTLQLTIRLTDIHDKSKIARRANLDPRFAEIVVRLNELCDSPEDVAEVIEAAEHLGNMRYPNHGESAAKTKLHDMAED